MKIADLPQDVRNVLAHPLDFSVNEIPNDPVWFVTKPKTDLTPLAGEGAGGVYAMLADSGEILFVDSEGAGGIVASSLKEFLQLVVTHPYWLNLLKFSGGGSLAEMRRAVPFAATDFDDCYPEAAAAVALVCDRLGLSPSEDAIALLHRSVTTSPQRLRLFASDGSEFDSLFNKFTVNSNPSWKDKLP
jgi:hypothetical protein